MLKDLLNNVSYQLYGSLDIPISHISTHSTDIKDETLFICKEGYHYDSHNDIPMLIKKGVKAFVVEYPVEFQKGITYILVNNSDEALAYIIQAFYDYPAKKLHLIGVTGTKGKTTTATMIYEVLKQAHIPVGLIGTTGIYYDNLSLPSINTTPSSPILARTMVDMLQHNIHYCIMEVSSLGVMHHRVTGLTFDQAIFTNLSSDHVSANEHPSFEHYKQCKKWLFTHCLHAYMNKDDPFYEEFIEDITVPIHPYSIKDISHLTRSITNQHFQTSFIFHDALFISTLPGTYNIMNLLPCILVSLDLAIPLRDIQKASQHFVILGRNQLIPVKDYYVMIDYAHNAYSYRVVLDMIKDYNFSRIICVYGSGGYRDHSRRELVGEEVAKHHAYSILTTDNARGENVHHIINEIIQGIKKYNGDYKVIIDRKSAILYALDYAKSQDIILLLGKGHERYQIDDQLRKVYFNEYEIVEEYKHK